MAVCFDVPSKCPADGSRHAGPRHEGSDDGRHRRRAEHRARSAAAREHARRQAGQSARHRTDRAGRPTRPTCPPGVEPDDVALGRDARRRRVRRPPPAPRHASCASRTSTATPACNLQVFVGAEPDRAAQPGRHGEGAVAGLPRARAHCCCPTMGRVLMTFVADTSGAHDALCGHLNRAAATAKYGDGGISRRDAQRPRPAGARRRPLRARPSRPDRRRQPVPPGARRRRRLAAPRRRRSGPAHVELRAELDLSWSLANVPHPLDDRPDYTAGDGPAHRLAGRAARPRPVPRRPAPSGCGPSRTPRTCCEERRHDRHRSAAPVVPPEGPPLPTGRRRPRRGRRRPGAVEPRARAPATRCASSTSAATRPSTASSTTPTTRPSATRRPTRSPRSATSSSSPARSC